MLKVAGINVLTQNVLKMKGIPYTIEPSDTFYIETRDLILSDPITIINYIDERYPIPQLISGDLANRTRIRELASIALKDKDVCDRLALIANPFVFGDTITLVDLIVFEKTSHIPYKDYMFEILKTNTTEYWL
jgi:glutathione S-transferase